MPTTDSQDNFILKYRLALDSDMTLDQFANQLRILPSSVTRRRNKILQSMKGMSLPSLLKDNGDKDVVIDFDQDEFSIDSGFKTIDKSGKMAKRIVITAAQNATPINKRFWKALLNYCEQMNADLMVIPYRYRNPTSIWKSASKEAEWWDSAVEPYLVFDDVKICKGLRVLGQIRIVPTAANPVGQLEAYTGVDSAIVGHPKKQLMTVPTPNKTLPKIYTSTGSVTRLNYTDSKAGHKGAFHHSPAAVVVEVDGDIHHMREIHAEDDGSFYDLDKRFTQTSVIESNKIAGLVTGDSHAEFADEQVERATYLNSDSMANVLNPDYLVYHDVEDFYRRNHHHRGNPILAYGKHHNNRNNVEEGLQVTADYIDRHSRPGCTNIIIKSNHDEALDRWLKEADPKLDPENMKFYHYMMYYILASVKETDTGYSSIDPFKFWCGHPDEQLGLINMNNTKFLARDESFSIEGIEVGFHGDKGPNGARGSAKAFAKIGPKTIIGHSHSPRIEEGAYQVGVSAKLNLEYVSGPSSWLQTHCIIYPNGKRTLINIIDGKWRI